MDTLGINTQKHNKSSDLYISYVVKLSSTAQNTFMGKYRSAFVQTMACLLNDAKPLSETVLIIFSARCLKCEKTVVRLLLVVDNDISVYFVLI